MLPFAAPIVKLWMRIYLQSITIYSLPFYKKPREIFKNITNMPDLFPLCSPWVFFTLFMHCMHFLFLPSIQAETYWFGGTAWFSLESCSIYAFAFIARNHWLLVLVCEVKFEIKCFALQSNTFWFKNKSITKKYIKKKPKYVSIPLFWLPPRIYKKDEADKHDPRHPCQNFKHPKLKLIITSNK